MAVYLTDACMVNCCGRANVHVLYILYCIVHFTSFLYVHWLAKYSLC